jgi:hypothetical protein
MFFCTFPLSTFQAQTLPSPEPAKRREKTITHYYVEKKTAMTAKGDKE